MNRPTFQPSQGPGSASGAAGDAAPLAEYALFQRVRDGLGDEIAIRYGDLAYRYEEVAGRARALASFLAGAGLSPGRRVFIVLADAPPFAWAFFGAIAAGGVVVMGNPRASPAELGYVLEYAAPEVVITSPEVACSLAQPLARAPGLRAVLLVPEGATGDDPEREVGVPEALAASGRGAAAWPLARAIEAGTREPIALPLRRADDPALWLLTSGSTGRPKAAVHAHRGLIAHTEAYAFGTVGYRRGDVTMSVPRLFFGYATGTNLLFPFAAGASVALFSEPPFAETVARAAERYRPSVVTNVPTMLSKLLERDAALRERGEGGLSLPPARFHISAGEALPPSLYERFTSRFSVPIYDGIGSAETFHIFATNRPGDVRKGSLGRATPGFELSILPEAARTPQAAPVPPGEEGVLWVRGPSVAMEYAGDPEGSAETFFGSWCRTGDVCRMDEQGYLHYAGRADSRFKVGGIWVAPAEVEACLAAHEAVAEAAVVPYEDGEGLRKPEAHVVVRPAYSAELGEPGRREALADDLRAHVRAELGASKHPRRIIFANELPRTGRGKVDRAALREGRA